MFRKITRNILGGIAVGIFTLGIAALSVVPVMAQVGPTTGGTRSPVVRIFPDQQIASIRTTFAFNSCVQSGTSCTVKILNASLPYNAVVLRVTAVVYTVFNSTTSDVVSLGTTAALANQIVSTCSLAALGNIACTMAGASSTTGALATGGGATQTGTNGGFDLFLKWTSGTGSTATTGLTSLVIEYVMPNDGLCTTVGANATAPGC